MIAQPGLEHETFKNLLEKIHSQAVSADSLERIRQKAWHHYLSLGLPSRKNEAYRNIKLRHLFSQSCSLPEEKLISFDQIASWIYPECKNSVLVFVNGSYAPQFSSLDGLPSKIFVSTLEEAAKTYGAFLNNQWTQSLKDETDAFAVLNGALHQKGAFIYIPPKLIVEPPIQILHVIDNEDQFQMLMPRVQIFAGAHAEVSLIASQKNLGKGWLFC